MNILRVITRFYPLICHIFMQARCISVKGILNILRQFASTRHYLRKFVHAMIFRTIFFAKGRLPGGHFQGDLYSVSYFLMYFQQATPLSLTIEDYGHFIHCHMAFRHLFGSVTEISIRSLYYGVLEKEHLWCLHAVYSIIFHVIYSLTCSIIMPYICKLHNRYLYRRVQDEIETGPVSSRNCSPIINKRATLEKNSGVTDDIII